MIAEDLFEKYFTGRISEAERESLKTVLKEKQGFSAFMDQCEDYALIGDISHQFMLAGEYDDGTDLVAMGNNKYANLWFYLDTDGELVMLYGTAQYTSSTLAELESPPITLPLRITVHSFIIGRMIFKKSASAALEISSVFTTVFSPTLVSDHGNLAGLPDDDHIQYALADGSRWSSSRTLLLMGG